jgi:Collagen triple helix repeat (20 copies)
MRTPRFIHPSDPHQGRPTPADTISMKKSLRLPSPALVISILALVVALSGTAVAAKRYLITNTKQISPAALKQLTRLAAVQGAQGPAGTAGKEGAAGAAGAAGATGAAGAEGAAGKEGAAGEIGPSGPRSDLLWAVVEPGGEVKRFSEAGVTAVEKGTGTTEVSFANFGDVTNCAYEATVGLASQSATAFPGFATVVRSAAHDDAVYVQTYDLQPESHQPILASLGFHLSVLC